MPPGEDPSPGGTTVSPGPTEEGSGASGGMGAPRAGVEGEYARALVALSNEARAKEGLDALAWSDCAAEQGRDRAAALVNSEQLVHAPLGTVLEACAPVVGAAENLSRAAVPPSRIVDAWLGSPGHRMNILDPDAAQAGAGCVRVREDGFLCSMIFLG